MKFSCCILVIMAAQDMKSSVSSAFDVMVEQDGLLFSLSVGCLAIKLSATANHMKWLVPEKFDIWLE
ncbi:MAG: hypothetical protein KKH60_07650 [Proteobacteria bacterium]|nr:hypothetical protein [Pseudomonadota bacterium]